MNPTATERDSPKSSSQANKGIGADDDSRKPSPEANRDSVEDLDKVRDLLFGAQFREHSRHISQLEESLTRLASELKQEMNSRFDSLESAVKRHVEALTAQIKSEHDGRTQSITDLLRDLNELGKTVATSTAQLDQQASKESRELRQRIAEQQQALLTEIQQKNAELSTVMKGALEELRSEKVTRATLAELFVKSAQSLSGDIAQTGGK